MEMELEGECSRYVRERGEICKREGYSGRDTVERERETVWRWWS